MNKYLKSIFTRRIQFELSPGLYHYNWIKDDCQRKVHLRVEPGLYSTLMINGNYFIRLNPSATQMLYLILEKKDTNDIVCNLAQKYHVSTSTIKKDFETFFQSIESILSNGHVCFHENQDVEILYPFSTTPNMPYRMDIALTYSCNNECYHCYNVPERILKPLGFYDWLKVIDKIWEVGIPHVVFTGGEPTIVHFLPKLINYAKNKDMIVGLNTNGRRLNDVSYLMSLCDAGLDHVQITIESSHPEIHDKIVNRYGAWEQTTQGIQNALNSNLFVMTNTTLLRENYSSLNDTLDFLSQIGVPTIGLNALIYSGKGCSISNAITEEELSPLLEHAANFVEISQQRLIWYTPTRYCKFDPMSLNLGIKGCSAARYNMCIEPDGSVIPCQSYYSPVGNILSNKWDEIWNHPLCISIRNRQYLNEECQGCIIKNECGGGCPLIPHTHDVDLSLGLIP